MKALVLALTFFAVKAFAQSPEEAVKKPIMLLFDGMRKGDSTILKTVFAPNAVLQTVAQDKEGKTGVASENITAFIKAVSTPHTEIYDERIKFDLIRIDGDLAIAWTPYQFYVGEKFSHCGVNSFQLVRLAGEWKIQYIIDTRRRTNCN